MKNWRVDFKDVKSSSFSVSDEKSNHRPMCQSRPKTVLDLLKTKPLPLLLLFPLAICPRPVTVLIVVQGLIVFC